MSSYTIYTDGATSGNGYEGAQGGVAYLIMKDGMIVNMYAAPITNATNNICELEAMIEGCRAAIIWADAMWKDTDPHFTVCSDSAYIINCYKQEWYKKWQENGWINSKKQPVANKELWEELIPYFKDSRFSFEKVMGHSGDKYNEIVDRMAVAIKQGKDISTITSRWIGYREEEDIV